MRIYEQIIKPGYLCFDIGANMGNKSQLMLSLGSKVIAFEPQTQCYDNLVSRFHNDDNIIIEKIALSNYRGESSIFISNAHTISSMSTEFIGEVKKSRFASYNWNEQEPVNTDMLDNMISKYGVPNFIKIDVEGYEYEVLTGLSDPDSVNLVSIEFTPELKHNTKKCMDYLISIGCDLEFNYSDGETGVFTYENWLDYDSMWDILSKDESRYTFGDVYIKNKNYSL
mgnify:CR=1 FL=1